MMALSVQSPAQRILSRSLMKLDAKDVSFFPVSPAMSLSEDRSWEAYKTMRGNETVTLCNFHRTALHDTTSLRSAFPLLINI
uniref:Uncharacterized protein n=1 Tax=Arundo donax TaxID=35708 RepID=A0A0A9DPT8_ARUDO